MFAVAEASGRGWAHLVALLIAAGVAVIVVSAHRHWDLIRNPSPTPPGGAEIDVTPGETDDLTPDDTGGDTAPDTGWWGRRVRLPDGSVVVRQPDAVVADDDIDVGLEDEETREDMADRLVAGGGSYADWVREIMGAFDVSEATAKRAIREARERADT